MIILIITNIKFMNKEIFRNESKLTWKNMDVSKVLTPLEPFDKSLYQPEEDE